MKQVRKWCVTQVDKCGIGPLLRPMAHGARKCLQEQGEYLRRVPYLISRDRTIKNYLNGETLKKLHLGASDKILPGWLNSDLQPSGRASIFLDASKRFPFPDSCMHYVFCEHFIEHITPSEAAICLAEAFRCLRNGGVLRIATPDLKKYSGLFQNTLSAEQADFLEKSKQFFKMKRISPCITINHLIYNWGHRFIYTSEELIYSLKEIGFREVLVVSVGQSQHVALQGIEQHWKFCGVDMNNFETFVIEATK